MITSSIVEDDQAPPLHVEELNKELVELPRSELLSIYQLTCQTMAHWDLDELLETMIDKLMAEFGTVRAVV